MPPTSDHPGPTATADTLVAVDLVEALLDGPRARGAFLLRALLAPPWSLRIEDEAALTLVAVLRGSLVVTHDDGTRHACEEGDVVIVRGPEPYTVADDPATPPTLRVGPGGACTSDEDGRPLADELSLGVRTWGTADSPSTVLMIATYETAGEAGRPLVSALPRVVLLRRDEWRSPLVDVLAAEMTVDAPGQRTVLDRLLDVLLISALRDLFTSQEDAAPGWFFTQADPVVGPALARLHASPARPWTLESLAPAVGVSRAALARRFSDLIGEPPMAYLTSWRLALAADLLCDPAETVASVARKVGYSTPFALSAAFKRERGMSPQQHRLRSAAAEPA